VEVPAGERSPDAEGAEGPVDLAAAWKRICRLLPMAEGTSTQEVAFPAGFEGGCLRVGVRSEVWRFRVRERLAQLDLGAILPGFRRVEVDLMAEEGRTGREIRSEQEDRTRAFARAAAEAHPVVKQLLAAFDAQLESVEAPPQDSSDSAAAEEAGEPGEGG
jgi:hypothetical protein